MSTKTVKLKLTLKEFNEELANMTKDEFLQTICSNSETNPFQLNYDSSTLKYNIDFYFGQSGRVYSDDVDAINKITSLICTKTDSTNEIQFGLMETSFANPDETNYSVPQGASIEGSRVEFTFPEYTP